MATNFLDYEDLILELKDNKCLKFCDDDEMKEAKKSIIDNGYINIVTGYRSLFGKKDEFGNFKFNNKYFSQLENVYLFDRDLKSVYLRYLITTKKNISNRIAHVFSESHLNIPNAYTSSINFDENLVDSEGAAFLRLQDSIKKVIRKGKNKSIIHHKEKYGENNIPLWVVTNGISMGELTVLYKFLKDDHKTKVRNCLLSRYNDEYKTTHVLYNDDIYKYLDNAKFFRNACAHNDRFYCLKCRVYYNLNRLKKDMKYYLSLNDYVNLSIDIDNLFDKYSKLLNKKTINKLHNITGL